MATTTTKTQQQTQTPQAPVNKGNLVKIEPPRLAMPAIPEHYQVDDLKWRTLVEATFPGAKTTAAVLMALEYCHARKLDILKKVVHIVSIYSATANDGQGGYVETVWPGIAEIRTTAMRTGNYAGMDVPVFGPKIARTFEGRRWNKKKNAWEEMEPVIMGFPEWCQITVWRFVQGQRVPFPGPQVPWLETYQCIGRTEVPNEMWQSRPQQQLEKCAEAAALRRAFPEELGDEWTVDEAGLIERVQRMQDVTTAGAATVAPTPAEPKVGEFKPRSAAEQTPETPKQEEGKGTRKTKAKAKAKEKATDVVDENAKKEKAPVEFEEFNTTRPFLDFSSKYLAEPGRTVEEAKAWEEFYRAKMKALKDDPPKDKTTGVEIAWVKEGLADLLVQYNLIIGKAEQQATS